MVRGALIVLVCFFGGIPWGFRDRRESFVCSRRVSDRGALVHPAESPVGPSGSWFIQRGYDPSHRALICTAGPWFVIRALIRPVGPRLVIRDSVSPFGVLIVSMGL